MLSMGGGDLKRSPKSLPSERQRSGHARTGWLAALMDRIGAATVSNAWRSARTSIAEFMHSRIIIPREVHALDHWWLPLASATKPTALSSVIQQMGFHRKPSSCRQTFKHAQQKNEQLTCMITPCRFESGGVRRLLRPKRSRRRSTSTAVRPFSSHWRCL